MLGTLIVVWLLIPDLATGPTPVTVQRQPKPTPVSPAPGDEPLGTASGSEIVVELGEKAPAGGGSVSSAETEVPAAEADRGASRSARSEVTSVKAPPSGPVSVRLFLQAGAFAKVSGAEGRLAEVQKLGFLARFEKASTDGKELTRVLVGPFDTRSQVEEAQATLAAAKIETFVRKLD